MNACTIVARNYLAQARVLAESFLEHHPDGTFVALLLDDLDREVDESAEPFRVLHVDEIGIDTPELHRMAMMYDVLEFATAVKPWFLRTLLDQGFDHVAYFDPDIQVFAPLDDLAELARSHGIVLTPHTTEPLPRDGLEPSERTLLISGMFNLGFIAVGAGSDAFLGWWRERLRLGLRGRSRERLVRRSALGRFRPDAVRAPHRARSGLQRRDLEPARREEWNASNGRYLVNGLPLRFFHFSGFDPRAPHVLSKFQSRAPRILLSEHQAVGDAVPGLRESASRARSRAGGRPGVRVRETR